MAVKEIILGDIQPQQRQIVDPQSISPQTMRQSIQPKIKEIDLGSIDSPDNIKSVSEGLASRFRHQLWNKTIAETVHSLAGDPEIEGMKYHAAEAMKELTKNTKIDDETYDAIYNDLLKELQLLPEQRETPELKKYRQYKPTGKAPMAYDVDEAGTIGEKVVDVGAGIAGFMAQIAILRKKLPGVSEKVLWETQSLANGGTPGQGLAMYGAFGAAGKAGKALSGKIQGAGTLAKIGKKSIETSMQSAAMGGITASQGGSIEDIAVSAGIPFGFAAAGALPKAYAMLPKSVKAQLKEQDRGKVTPQGEKSPTPIYDAPVPRSPKKLKSHIKMLENVFEQQATAKGLKVVRDNAKASGMTDLKYANMLKKSLKKSAEAEMAEMAQKEQISTDIPKKPRDLSKVDLSKAPTGEAESLAARLKLKQEQIIQRPIIEEAVKSGKMKPEDVDMVKPYKGEPWADKFIADAAAKKNVGEKVKTVFRAGKVEGKENPFFYKDVSKAEKGYGKQKPYEVNYKNPKKAESMNELSKELFGNDLYPDVPPIAGKKGLNEKKYLEIDKKIANELKKQGYDSIELPNEVAILDTSLIKPKAPTKKTIKSEPIQPPKPLSEKPVELPVKPTVKKSFWKRVLPKWLGGEGKEPPKPKVQVQQSITKRIGNALKGAKEVFPEIQAEQREARAKKFAIAESIMARGAKKGSAEAAIEKAKGALKGPLTDYSNRFQSVRNKFKPEELDSLFKTIVNSNISAGEKVAAHRALNKLLGDSKTGYATALQRNEINLIHKLFGSDLSDAALARRPFVDKAWDISLDVLGLPRTILASMDMSGIMRQAWLLGSSNPKEFFKMIKNYHKSFFSEKYTKKLNKEIKSSPDYEEAIRNGLAITKFGKEALDVLQREERFATRFAEKIPGIKQSERSYVSGLNWFRMTMYSKFKQQILESGQKVNTSQMRKVTQMINDFTGRSSFREGIKSQRLSAAINAVFFAPRFALSRFKAPFKIASSDPFVRKQAAKAFTTFIGTNLATMFTAKMLLGDKLDLELDPRSSDFGKMKVGNLRIDLWSGFLPVVRFVTQIATGQRKTTSTKRISDADRREVITRFIRSKESPIASVVTDVLVGKKYTGEEMNLFKFNQENEFYQRLTPLAIQDIVDTSINDGWPLMLVAGPAAFYGIGIQSYKETKFQEALKVKEDSAKRQFNKSWEDLTPQQQKVLRRIDKNIGITEKEAALERTDYDFLGDIVQKEMDIGRKIEKSLPSNLRNVIESSGSKVGGISRNFGEFRLNDKRYQRYQSFITENLNILLSNRTKQSDWDNLSKDRKQKIVDKLIDRAKNISKRKLFQEINTQSRT